MEKRRKPDVITPEEVYLSRRKFMKAALTASSAAALLAACAPSQEPVAEQDPGIAALDGSTDELGGKLTPEEDITGFTNYYEFSTDKRGPTKLAQDFVTSPWSIQIGGLVDDPQEIQVSDWKQQFEIHDRIYRMRCVEGWSMVIPWQGILMNDIIDAVKPQKSAQYVRFESVFNPDELPGQRYSTYPWPYVEGLRMDEAENDLTLLATGLYDKDLTPQNGAPIRLVVPWKYGFKSMKAIKRIDFVEEMPTSLWMALAPNEYGFYANVNPAVDHPRWSQATEQRIGEQGRRETLLFNGYEEEVAYLYEGMDLNVFY